MNIKREGIIMKDFRGFDPASRRTGATVSINGEDIIVTKVAVETILILCGDQDNGSIKEKKRRKSDPAVTE